MKAAVAKWLELAEIDLKAAQVLLKDSSLSSAVCFHAQQAIEKYLKALIESRDINPPKSHDLIMLYGQVEDIVNIEEDTLAKLNQIYIDSRYPASLGTMPEGLPDTEDAKEFYDFACAVYDKAKRALQPV